jgi:hypothetical protein
MTKDSSEYAPLAPDEEKEGVVDHESQRIVKTSKMSWLLIGVVGLETVLLFVMFITRNSSVREPLLYSEYMKRHSFLGCDTDDAEGPAQSAIEYETKVFRSGFERELSEYQGEPSLELDGRWKQLYKCKRPHDWELLDSWLIVPRRWNKRNSKGRR